MRVENLRIGMRVRHPQYGEGEVKALTERTADILFTDGKRTLEPYTSGIEPCEPTAQVGGLEMPLEEFIEKVVEGSLDQIERRRKDSEESPIGRRWHKGLMVIKPADRTLQSKEVPLETFFHKLVMVRNNLRVLEQKINASEAIPDAEKLDWHQYITRSYGSLTTFNILFAEKDDQFSSKG